MGPLQKETGDLTTLDKEKTEVIKDFCASVFNGKCFSHAAQIEKGKCKDWKNEHPEPTEMIKFKTI